MILRKAKHIQVGDIVVMKHDRYPGSKEFKILSKEFSEKKIGCGTYDCIPCVKFKTKVKDQTFGPDLQLLNEDMVQITSDSYEASSE